jgi:hypothetical protein
MTEEPWPAPGLFFLIHEKEHSSPFDRLVLSAAYLNVIFV